MPAGLLVLGTDTGVGKTFVAAGILHGLRERGHAVGALKVVETGFDAERWTSDAKLLAMAADEVFSPDRQAPIRLRMRLAPIAAALEENVSLTSDRILKLVRARLDSDRMILIETPGGLRVPLAPGMSNVELAQALGLPAILVGRNEIGTINHTVLSCEAARAAGIHVLGFVLNGPTDASARRGKGNAYWIQELCDVPCLGEVPHMVAAPAPVDAQHALRWLTAAAAATGHLNWEALLGALALRKASA
jgi:dethiobiotin synthetase